MKIKSYKLIFTITLTLLLLISSVNAAENTTDDNGIALNEIDDNENILTATDNQIAEINTDNNFESSENTQETNESCLLESDDLSTLGQSNINQTDQEILTQNKL